MDYFTLRALAQAWDAAFRGATLTDAWSQSPRELSLRFEAEGPDGPATSVLRVVCEGALPLAFDAPGGGRQKRNTADVFAGIEGASVGAIRAAALDRHVVIGLDRGALQIVLFGSRPNVLWTTGGPSATVREAFLRGDVLDGTPAPQPRPAPDPRTPDAIAARWAPRGQTLGVAARRLVPLLPAALSDAALRRVGLDPDAPPRLAPESLGRLAATLAETREAAETPAPAVLWRGVPGAGPGQAFAEALLPLAPEPVPEGWRAERFDTVRAASRVFARRALGQRRFQEAYRPLERALAAEHARRARSADAMVDELAQPSRADRYERWAHLLMASAAGRPAGAEAIEVADLLADGAPVTVPLDPARTAVENAERYYDKARRTRRARALAEARWEDAQAAADALADALAELRALDRVEALEAFRAAHAGALGALSTQARGQASEPFHRIDVGGGFTALVGKHARGNAHLTTKVASPHDLWLHARGVPGSHVVVRRPARDAQVPEPVVLAAARLAAWYSEARRQPLAPVQVTERKYVRPVKGGPPGRVRVDRERVVDVVPERPG